MGPAPRDHTGDERVFRPDWALTEEDTVMGDPRAARELVKVVVLPRDRQLVRGLTTPSLISGADTLTASICAYMETVKERTVDLARLLSETDVKLHKVKDERNGLKEKLSERDQELATERAESSGLRTENTTLRDAAKAWREEKHRMEDEARAREDRVEELKAALDRAREGRAGWKNGYMRVRSLAAGAVRLYQKSEQFKELVGMYCLQSFTEGALALKEFVDEKASGLDYTGVDCFLPAEEV